MKQRSHALELAPASSPGRTAFSNRFGTVRVYTRRHINGCKLSDPNQQHCTCPKWLYKNARGSKPVQEAANTPSFTEACDVAQEWLKGLDPEIRAARALIAVKSSEQGMTAEEAIERYFAVLARRRLSESYMDGLRWIFQRKSKRPGYGSRRMNMSMLDFLDEQARTLGHAVRLEEISGAMLDRWANGWGTNDTSSRHWRDKVGSFFTWAAGRELMKRMPPCFDAGESIKKGNRCGHFEDAQFNSLIETLPFMRFKGPKDTRPGNYVPRMRAFLELGRWAGMAMVDIVNFDPARQLSAENVIRYQRHKTDEWGEIALYKEVADRLRVIPSELGSRSDQPLNFAGRGDVQDVQHNIGELWRRRFTRLCKAAGITEIRTEHGAIRRPHPHMLRDTCAIDAISHGVDITHVARMLGHKNIQVTQRSYLYWIEKRSKYCIEDQRAALARRVQVAPATESVPADRLGRALVN
jgi:hypothetical protein